MEQTTLERNLGELKEQLKETTWAARNYRGYHGVLMEYQRKYIGRCLDKTRYDIRKYR